MHTVVNVLASKPYPVAIPPCVGTRMISMPFAREEKKYVTCLDGRFRLVGRLEHASSLGLVEQLVFVECASAFQVEVVTVGMTARRIFLLLIRSCPTVLMVSPHSLSRSLASRYLLVCMVDSLFSVCKFTKKSGNTNKTKG